MRRRLHILCPLLLSGCAVGVALSAVAGAAPLPAPAPSRATAYAADIAYASQRFGIPQPWIRAVIRAESGGDPAARSRAGAQGLMQLMSSTWQTLRTHLGLGADPFDPHDNIIAGTAYLREMYDRFGASGVLAAYNAGPGRYADSLAGVRPLPFETRAYVAAIAASLALPEQTGSRPAVVAPPNEAALTAEPVLSVAFPATHDLSGLTPVSTGLFVPVTRQDPAQ